MEEDNKGFLKRMVWMSSAIGVYLDNKFYTNPWFTIIFFILGIIAGFRNIYTLVKKYGF